jgi:Domain of unknown function (DUF397)
MREKMRLTPVEARNMIWRKSRLSTNHGSCVEVASTTGKVALRDSKDPEGPILLYTPEEWHAFLDGAKRGEFDGLGR